ncbi:MAG: C25 family cysteine peptidase, partial [Candidatus Promineifilaceae bacterium]
RTALYGATSIGPVDPDHDIDLYLNGIHVDTITWDGETHIIADSLIEPGIVRPGTNTLVIDNRSEERAVDNGIESSGDSFKSPLDIIRLDWLEIEYSRLPQAIDDRVILEGLSGDLSVGGFSSTPKLIDITNPIEPKEATGWNYEKGDLEFVVENGSTLLAVGPQGLVKNPDITPVRDSNWRDASIQADLIILSTSELSPTLTQLVEWREEQGLGVVQVSVEDVYNEFGDGEESPDSIANFIRHALSEWRDPKPSYLLLVGEASYDYRNYLGELGQNVIPALMVLVEYGGETVSDARLADADLDGLPDIAIGRWPVSSRNEVTELVERTIAYEQGMGSDKVLMAADGTSQEFTNLSEEVLIGSGLPEPTVTRLYGVPADQFTDAWNDGAWLVSYIGHGSIDRWGKDDVFTTGAVPDLNSDSSPPIVIQLTCLTGFFAHPTVDSISEIMLRHEKGPVVIIAATSLTLSSSQRPFGVNLIKALQDHEVIRIGDALQQAKAGLDIERNRELTEISETFTLLGDPSALIIRP